MNSTKLGKLIGGITLGVLLLSQTVYASAYGNVNVATLNVRKGASTDQKVIGSVGPNDYIHILNKADDGWYAVETATDELGYISGQYVDIQKAKGVINANGVNVRNTPDYSGAVISQVYKNNIVYAYAQVGDWFLIQNGDGEGYIHREFVDGLLIDQLPNKKAAAPKQAAPAEKTIAVATTTVNLRQNTSTNSDVLKKIGAATVLSVQSIDDEWVKVTTSDSTEGYIAKEYLNIGKESAKDKLLKGVSQSSTDNTSSSNQGGGKGTDVISYAKQFLGNPYVYGGNSLTNGTDCSGFTSQIFKNFGVSLSRSSSAQYANNGVHVDAADIRPGDLMFYGSNGNISHVGIYMGNDQIIHASTEKTGITTGVAFRTSGKPLVGIKRVL